MEAEQTALLIFNMISLPICVASTIFGFLTTRIAYPLLTTSPKFKNEDSNRFFYGRWRKIGGSGYLFFGIALLSLMLSWLSSLHIIALIAYVLMVMWGLKWDDGRLGDRVIQDIP